MFSTEKQTISRGLGTTSQIWPEISASGERALESGPIARPAVRREHVFDR